MSLPPCLVMPQPAIPFLQYFKRRREAVEVVLGAGGGLGVAAIFLFIHTATRYNAYVYTVLPGMYYIYTQCYHVNLKTAELN